VIRPAGTRIARGALLWAALATPAQTADALGLNEPRPAWQQAAGAAVLAVAVALARRCPAAAYALTAALGLAAAPALFSVSYGCALGVLALLLGLREARVLPAVLLFAAVGCAGTVKIALVGVDPAPQWVVLTGTLLFGCVFPWLGGRYWRQSRELARAGWTLAARLEGEQRIAEERARLRERARIAQDMHDSLGHELSLIALRAGALQVAADLPDRHRAAAADLRAAAAEATDRLHRIIGVLREDDEPVPLAPAGEDVEQLVARAAASGLPVRWAPGGTGTAVPSGSVAGRVLYRVVREALTNAARHAPGAPVTVAVQAAAEGTTVTVGNGRATQRSSPSAGGFGLLGLRTAVTAIGGTFEAGPHGDGFRVRVHLPDQPADPLDDRRAGRAPERRTARATGHAAPVPGRLAPTEPRTPSLSAPFTRARRRVAVASAGVLGAGVVLVGGAFGWYAYTESHSVLEPAVYARLRLGDTVAEIAPVLPDRTVRDAPAERAPSPPPRGAECRYYRASGELLVSVDHFRLCFDGAGRLVVKDVVPRAGLAGEGREEYREFVR
jgi:signal transduction histidine kinase